MPEPSLEAPADPLPAPAASGDGAEAEPDEGSEPAEVTESIPAPEDFVRVADWIPDIYTDLRYATDNNFTGQAIYDFSGAYLRYGTVQKLAAVQETVAESGCSLLIWDAFRPASAQFRLWEICPDPAYVANPEKGFSSHSRGNTVDVTLVTADGQPVDMPTDFDDFTALALQRRRRYCRRKRPPVGKRHDGCGLPPLFRRVVALFGHSVLSCG